MVNSIKQVGPEHAAAGLRWLFERREHLGLTTADLARLLGVSEHCLDQWERYVAANSSIDIEEEVLERIGLLLSLNKALVMMTPDGLEDKAHDLFGRPVDLFGLRGQSIRQQLLADPSLESMRSVYRRVGSVLV